MFIIMPFSYFIVIFLLYRFFKSFSNPNTRISYLVFAIYTIVLILGYYLYEYLTRTDINTLLYQFAVLIAVIVAVTIVFSKIRYNIKRRDFEHFEKLEKERLGKD